MMLGLCVYCIADKRHDMIYLCRDIEKKRRYTMVTTRKRALVALLRAAYASVGVRRHSCEGRAGRLPRRGQPRAGLGAAVAWRVVNGRRLVETAWTSEAVRVALGVERVAVGTAQAVEAEVAKSPSAASEAVAARSDGSAHPVEDSSTAEALEEATLGLAALSTGTADAVALGATDGDATGGGEGGLSGLRHKQVYGQRFSLGVAQRPSYYRRAAFCQDRLRRLLHRAVVRAWLTPWLLCGAEGWAWLMSWAIQRYAWRPFKWPSGWTASPVAGVKFYGLRWQRNGRMRYRRFGRALVSLRQTFGCLGRRRGSTARGAAWSMTCATRGIRST